MSAEGSGGGCWTFPAQTNDLLEHTDTLTLATFYGGTKGGFPYGINRHDDIALETVAERRKADPEYPNDPDILPGTNNVYDVDGPGGGRRAPAISGMQRSNEGFQCETTVCSTVSFLSRYPRRWRKRMITFRVQPDLGGLFGLIVAKEGY